MEEKIAEAPPAYSSEFDTNYNQPTGVTYPTQTPYSPHGYIGPAATNQYPMSGYPTTVVVTQPVPSTVLTTTVPDHMGLALFATFCCFFPLGIFAILKASDSRAHLARGDISQAVTSAGDSRRLSLISIAIGILALIGIIIAVVVVVVNSTTTYTYYYG